jgi:predicted metal-binding membrane protein
VDRPAPSGARGIFVAAGLAWAALLWWSRSRYAPYLSHADVSAGAGAAVPLFLAGWTLMVVATMVPATAKLRRAFGALTSRRGLVALLDVTFVGAWVAVGAAFYAGDLLVHEAVESSRAVEAASERFLLPATLVLAGLYQMSRLSRACLTRCRSPQGFLYRLWRGRPRVDTLKIGLAYTASCVGCCWALMLTMFAVGMANLAWMAALTVVVLVDRKTTGRTFATATGLTLVLAGTLLAL